MNFKFSIFLLLALTFLCFANDAAAYIGPGAGLSVLGSLWAVVVAIVVALFALLTWPLRALWRRLRVKRAAPIASDHDHQT